MSFQRISEAPLLNIRKLPSAIFNTVLMDLRTELKFLLRDLVAYGLVVALQVIGKTKQGTFSLVTNLPWQAAFFLWRLREK
ncbi:hypothetical protein F7725_021601, partial [Dissostichus mawsoni]